MTAAREFWFQLGSFMLVGMLWGCSNAVLKQSTAAGIGGKKLQQAKGAASGSRDVWAGLRALLGTKVRRLYPNQV